MSQLYARSGIRFRYPDGWRISDEAGPQELSVTVEPAEESTAFWSLTLLFDCPPVDSSLQAALDAFEEEYEDLDAYPVERQIAHHPAIGKDIEFVCLELTNSAFLRAFRTGRFTAVLLYQATDQELKRYEGDFNEITASLSCDMDVPLE